MIGSFLSVLVVFISVNVYLYPSDWLVVTAINSLCFVCCASIFVAVTFRRQWKKEADEDDKFAREVCTVVTPNLQKEYRESADYHPYCKFLTFDLYKQGSSDILIDVYLIANDNGEYRKVKYMVLLFFLRSKWYPTPNDFKKAVFDTIKDAFYANDENVVLKRSNFTKERSLAVFFKHYKKQTFIDTFPEKAVLN